ncbi:hypothetical protein PQE12_gp46 [Arthrobacter phage Adumb2043]|uniref:Uncharacterized protein n=1 Tax=Arthrobacter phage Adumb2043 TaxID=2776851 RepID=A0A7M1CLA3_9CAUD|nr:hypothetical protein PQE12_gp46 [Arthrobacter phage Adumb2043]QOP65106.1 hypothetical protein SEA_ADUMB2043_46 [Arthrobacter phage Adumb2043]
MTAFIITKDKIDSDAVGTIGPRSASEADEARLRSGEGVAFRLLDDDREIYYYGRRLETSDADASYDGEPELAPLDCFGTPNAGAVIQEEKDEDGVWRAIN